MFYISCGFWLGKGLEFISIILGKQRLLIHFKLEIALTDNSAGTMFWEYINPLSAEHDYTRRPIKNDQPGSHDFR